MLLSFALLGYAFAGQLLHRGYHLRVIEDEVPVEVGESQEGLYILDIPRVLTIADCNDILDLHF